MQLSSLLLEIFSILSIEEGSRKKFSDGFFGWSLDQFFFGLSLLVHLSSFGGFIFADCYT
jgi:hypothetical protein